MKRTTVYLPEDLKARLAAEAERRCVTEAEVIRQAVERELIRRPPRGGFLSGDAGGLTARDVEEHLEGFGQP